MFMIPGQFIALLTFPGVIIHEVAHQIFCRLSRVAVFDVCYFQFANPAGFVVHESPRTIWQHLTISIAPFFINTLLGALISASSAISVIKFSSGAWYEYIMVWLGVSVAMHAFPSTADAKSLDESLSTCKYKIIKYIMEPVIGFMYVGSICSVFWLDLLYGIGVASLIPTIIILLLK